MSIVKRILKYTGDALFALVIISALLVGLVVVLGKGKQKFLVIESGSMEPAIKTGSIIVTLPAKSYTQGDVITFKQNSSDKNLVTHRIGAKEYPNGTDRPPVYLTSGDANKTFDPEKVKDADIVGRVIFTIPYAGYLTNQVKTPKGFVLFIVIPATIIIYEELRTLLREGTKIIKERKGLPKAFIALPIIGVLLITTVVAKAYLTDSEKSAGNTITTAAEFVAPTPSPSPLPSPSGQASPIPTPL